MVKVPQWVKIVESENWEGKSWKVKSGNREGGGCDTSHKRGAPHKIIKYSGTLLAVTNVTSDVPSSCITHLMNEQADTISCVWLVVSINTSNSYGDFELRSRRSHFDIVYFENLV